MTIRVDGLGSKVHFLAQEIELSDTYPAMVSTSAGEPKSGPQEPGAKREYTDDAQRYRRVIESFAGDRILYRQAKDDGDEPDPQTSNNRNRLRQDSKAERSAFEVPRPKKAHCDRDAVGDVKTDGCDRSGAAESCLGAEGRKGEEE